MYILVDIWSQKHYMNCPPKMCPSKKLNLTESSNIFLLMNFNIGLLPSPFSTMECDGCAYNNSLYTIIQKANRQNAIFKQCINNAVYIQRVGL